MSNHETNQRDKELEIVDTFHKAMKAVCAPLYGDQFSIEVRRSHIFADALKEARKAKFNPKRPFRVSLVGEWAVDARGPRREFFRLCAIEVQAKFFIGAPKHKFFSSDVSALQKNDFYNLGRFVAMSVMQGGNGFPFLAEAVYKYFCTG